MRTHINVAVIGVGNCAKSLIEGVALYTANPELKNGLAFHDIGGYKPENIYFRLAYDIDRRKVGQRLEDAIYAPPNCAINFDVTRGELRKVCGYTNVQMGVRLDGVSDHMIDLPEEEGFRPSDKPEPTMAEVVKQLRENNIDVLLNYLPVGSEEATKFYINACLEAKVPFVNCIPVFIVSNPEWEKRIREAGIPAIGDDMRSQLGASIMSQALQELFFNRGMHVKFHKQTNDGGNTDFANMLNQHRLKSKKISKENVIRSQNDIRGIPVPKNGIFAGPSSYIPYQGDNKVANFTIEAEGFGGAPVTLTAQLSVQDSPNSAGVVIDAIRYLQVARELGLVGSLRGPSSATQKTPPMQMMMQDAWEECQALAVRSLTNSLKESNTIPSNPPYPQPKSDENVVKWKVA